MQGVRQIRLAAGISTHSWRPPPSLGGMLRRLLWVTLTSPVKGRTVQAAVSIVPQGACPVKGYGRLLRWRTRECANDLPDFWVQTKTDLHRNCLGLSYLELVESGSDRRNDRLFRRNRWKSGGSKRQCSAAISAPMGRGPIMRVLVFLCPRLPFLVLRLTIRPKIRSEGRSFPDRRLQCLAFVPQPGHLFYEGLDLGRKPLSISGRIVGPRGEGFFARHPDRLRAPHVRLNLKA